MMNSCTRKTYPIFQAWMNYLYCITPFVLSLFRLTINSSHPFFPPNPSTNISLLCLSIHFFHCAPPSLLCHFSHCPPLSCTGPVDCSQIYLLLFLCLSSCLSTVPLSFLFSLNLPSSYIPSTFPSSHHITPFMISPLTNSSTLSLSFSPSFPTPTIFTTPDFVVL